MKKRMYGEMSVDTVFHSTRFDCQIPLAILKLFIEWNMTGTVHRMIYRGPGRTASWVDCLLLVFRGVSQAETTDF